MAVLTDKHSEEALAFWTLFKTMKPVVKKEVQELIVQETAFNDDITTDMMTSVSMASFQEIWDTPENKHWDDFIKNRLECTNREI